MTALQVKAMRVDVETCSSLSAGQTVCDMWGRSPLPKNATVALVGCPRHLDHVQGTWVHVPHALHVSSQRFYLDETAGRLCCCRAWT